MDDTSNLDAMNFLNEVAERYPQAISLASGRPSEAMMQEVDWTRRIAAFTAHAARSLGWTAECATGRLAQYGRTAGIIADLIVRQVGHDENIDCDASQLVVTAGCQEALDLCLPILCSDEDDVVMAPDPVYIGVTGVASRHRIGMVPVYGMRDSPEAALDAAWRAAQAAKKVPRALYLVPNFDNPTGVTLDEQERRAIIAWCAAHEVVIIEDNPYGMFRYGGEHQASMFSLDDVGCVIYCGTYSKTLRPALRTGFVLLPMRLFGSVERAASLSAALVQAKSFVTVNTSQITQAIVGGMLLEQNCSLRAVVEPLVEAYRRQRDAMLEELDRHCRGLHPELRWNVPDGGFFLVVELPFAMRENDARECAEQYGVLVMPLSFFALGPGWQCAVRLAFSFVNEAEIRRGIERFGAYVRARLGISIPPPATEVACVA